MAKLTSAQVREIQTVLYNLNRARAYLLSDRVVIATRKNRATTTLDYVRTPEDVLFVVDKQIGSDIAGLEMGIEYLNNFLVFNTK